MSWKDSSPLAMSVCFISRQYTISCQIWFSEWDLRWGRCSRKLAVVFDRNDMQSMAYRGYNPHIATQIALSGKLTAQGV